MKKTVAQGILLTVACLFALSLPGQGYTEVASAFTEYFPLKTGAETFPGSRSGLNALIPFAIRKEKENYLLAGANVEFIRFGHAPESFGVDRFYGISPVLGYTESISGRWKITAILSPFWNSDFKTGGGNALRFAGFARLARQLNESFSWRITAGYRQQYFGPHYILLAGIDWQAGERWRLFGDLPQNFTVAYGVSARVRAGLGLVANLMSYHISGLRRYFRYSYAHAGPFVEYNLFKNIVLRGDIDYSFTRKYEVYYEGDKSDATLIFFRIGEKPAPVSSPLEKGVVLRASLSYRVSNN